MTLSVARSVFWSIASFVFWLFLTPVAPAADFDFPPLSGRVVDQAKILSPGALQAISSELKAHEQKTTNQLVVVTVESLQEQTIEEYGYQLGRHWGIGQKGKNNGALLIVAPNARKVRIEVGYGLEDRLTDAVSRLIIERAIVPEFRAKRMEEGILAGARAMVRVLEGGDVTPARPRGNRDRAGHLPWLEWVWLLTFVGIFIFGARKSVFAAYPKREPCCSDKVSEKGRVKEGGTARTFLRQEITGAGDECRYKDDFFGGYDGGFNSGNHYGSGGGFSSGGFSGGGGGFGGGGASGGW